MDAPAVRSGRRRFLLGATALALIAPSRVALATPQAAAELLQKLVKGAPQQGRVALDIADIAENGNAVPLTVTVESPMTDADHVTAIHVVSDGNPSPGVISVRLGPRNGKAEVSLRIRLAQTENVIAVAEMSDGSLWVGSHEVAVSAGAAAEERIDTLAPDAKPPDVKPRIHIPSQIRPGEVIEINTLVTHDMESGQRRDASGAVVPRKILRKMTCAYNGRPVFEAALEPAIAANPSIAFFLRAVESGILAFAWIDDDGTIYGAKHPIRVG